MCGKNGIRTSTKLRLRIYFQYVIEIVYFFYTKRQNEDKLIRNN
jgi:hypothetical protein